MRILINASNLTGSGAKLGTGIGLIPELLKIENEHQYLLLLPDLPDFRNLIFENNIEVVFLRVYTGIANDIYRLIDLFAKLPLLIILKKIDLVLSLGDFPPCNKKCIQMVYYHQAILFHPEIKQYVSWSKMKWIFFKLYLKFVSQSSIFLVQTTVVSDYLKILFNVPPENLFIVSYPIPNLLQTQNNKFINEQIMSCQKPLKLLFLADYYPHKNHVILISLVSELKRLGLDETVQIFITIDKRKNSAQQFLKSIEPYANIITNLGYLRTREEVAGALKSSTALFLPTLTESFGNIYLEALQFNMLILTSDRDFAHYICRDFALYFDPHDPNSIAEKIREFPEFLENKSITLNNKINEYLNTYPANWAEVAKSIHTIINQKKFV